MTPQAWLHTAHELHQRQQPFALVTVLRVTPPTSAKAGDKAVVTADGQIHGWIGGGCAQPAVVKTVRAALADGQARTIRISPAEATEEKQLSDVLEFGMACHSGGTLELFIDPVRPLASLTVLGDSPVARALCDLAPRVGFAVQLVAQGARSDNFPSASQVLDTDDAEAVAARLGEGGWTVVATQGRRDLQALKAALALKARRTWFVASARKGAVLKESLIAAGEEAACVNAIVAPAGAAIGPQTPEEIALSVLAAVVAARRSEVNDAQPAKSCCGGKKATSVVSPALATAEVAAAAPRASLEGPSATSASQAAPLPPTADLAPPTAPERTTAASPTPRRAGTSSCCGG